MFFDYIAFVSFVKLAPLENLEKIPRPVKWIGSSRIG